MCAYHYDVGRRGRSTRGARDRDRHRVRPVRLCERADDEHYEPNGTARLARCPARRRGAKHDCSERVGQQRRRERVERIVGLCRTVRASLHCALAEAAGGNGALGEWERRMGETRLPDEHHAGVEGGEPREEFLKYRWEGVVVAV